jgi:hypothetical protein
VDTKQAGEDCLEGAIKSGIIGEVVWATGGAIIGTAVARGPGAGLGIFLGTAANLSIDALHWRHCEKKVDKMEKDAKDARDNCYKQANVKPGDYNDDD